MKKFLFAALLPLFYFLLSFSFFSPPKAQAEGGEYACILTDSAYFYAGENEQSGLFILPKTYYVKVLVPSYPYSQVEYLSDGANTRKLTGYCKTVDLTFVEYIPERPFLFKTFEVTYFAGNTDDPFANKLTVTCAYYGDYTVGSKTYAYVLQSGEFGYVPKPTGFTYLENTEYSSRQEAETPPEEEPTPQGKGNGAQVAILIVLCLLVPIIAAAIFRSTKKPTYDFEEE
jgi:hypothetical protein